MFIILLWAAVMMCFFMHWEVSLVGMMFLLLMSLMYLNQSFIMSEEIISMNESMSCLMVFLSILLCFVSMLCTPSEKESSYILMILSLMVVLMLAFTSKNIVLFYMFFEISLIPTLILIISWGYQPERLQAGTYMMLYTVTASLPLLMFLVVKSFEIGSFNIFMMFYLKVCLDSVLPIVLMILAFIVKLPMYLFHLWLPKAHVEAPLAGSMILAGILLKLGGYGLYLMFKLFEVMPNSFILIFFTIISLYGGLMASFMCLRQSDIKSFVAYSSVAHMGLIVVGIMSNTSWGITSTKIILLTHGFTSPALFFLAYMTYMKTSSRSLSYAGGMLVIFPSMSILWFLMLSVNMAAPPSLNLVGELLILPVLWMLSWTFITVMMMLMLFSAIYNMYLFSSINHGGSNKLMLAAQSLKSADYLGLMMHFLPLLLIFKTQLFGV